MRKTEFSISRYKIFPPEIRVVLIGTLLTRGGYYMAWPFLSITLYKNFGLSPVSIGLFLSASIIFGSISGIYTGYLSDRLGRKKIINIGAAVLVLSYLLLSVADSLAEFAGAIAGVSVGCSQLEACSKALIGDRIADKKDREFALYFRYFVLNVGVAGGALLGVTIGLVDPLHTFLGVAVIHLLYGAALWKVLNGVKFSSRPAPPGTNSSFPEACAKIFGHRFFLNLLVCNALVALVYANFDSTLIQYLVRNNPESGRSYSAWLIAVNAVTVTIAQFPMLRALEDHSVDARLLLGIVLMFLSQILFAWAPPQELPWLILATVVLSLGELILFPTFSVMIDQITPDDLRGSYFGASNLYSLGSAAGPLAGGILLQYAGGQALFLSLAGICVSVLAIHVFSSKKRAKPSADLPGNV